MPRQEATERERERETPDVDPSGAPEPRRRGEPDSHRCRILIVDDHEDTAVTLSEALELLGHANCIARDGIEAVRIAEELHPEAIILDLGLPGMDGIEVAQTLRRSAWCKHTRIVALSGTHLLSLRKSTADVGIDEYVLKPASVMALLAALKLSSRD